MVGRRLLPAVLALVAAAAGPRETAAPTAGPKDLWLIGLAPFTGGLWDAGNSMRVAGDMMAEWINSEGQLLPGYRLRIVWQDARCNGERASQLILRNLLHQEYHTYPLPPHADVNGDGRIATGELSETIVGAADVNPMPVALLGCGCTGASMAVIPMAYNFALPMIAPTNTLPQLSDRKRFPNYFRVVTHDGYLTTACCAYAKLLGLTRLVAVFGGSGVWGGLAEVLVKQAAVYGLTLLGDDLSSEVAGFRGAQLAADSWGSAVEAMHVVQRSGARMTIALMYVKRFHLLLCAQVHLGLEALAWFFNLLSYDLWTVPDMSGVEGARKCSREDILGVANGLVMATPSVWRPDLSQGFACSSSRTVGEFRTELYRRQGARVGANGPVQGNYSIFFESPLAADAACMFALALRKLLFERNWTLAQLASRSSGVYREAVEVLGTSRFEGLQGELEFVPGSADSKTGGQALHQLQAAASPCTGAGRCGSVSGAEAVAVVSFRDGTLYFAAGESLRFHYPDEEFPVPSNGSAPAARLADFGACPPGQVWQPRTRACRGCPEGQVFMSQLGGCVCARGYHKADGRCAPCGAGNFTGSSGADTCTACPKGRFAAAQGQSACGFCRAGSYTSEEGATVCRSCGEGRERPELWTTMRRVQAAHGSEWSYAEESQGPKACGCDKGARRDENGGCEACGEGLDCAGMGDVMVEAGYYSGVPVSVYRCHREPRRCRGGLPGASCSPGRYGITCAECELGLTPGQDGSCVPCGGGDTTPFIILVLAGVLVLIGTYWTVSRNATQVTKSSAVMAAIICTGQMVSAMQILHVVGTLPLIWHEPLGWMMRFMSILSFDLEMLRLDCVSHMSPLARYTTKVTFIILVIVLVVLIHCASVLVLHRGHFRARAFVLKCTMGTAFLAFLIAIISATLSPLQCEHHPNQRWTIREFPSVACWESEEHRNMVIIGLVAFLCIPLPYMAKCAAVVLEFPRRMREGDVEFLQEYTFLFVRSRPEVYWYVIAHVARSFAIALVPLVPSVLLQIISLQVLMFASLGLTVNFRPWRTREANVVEVIITSLVMLFCSLANCFRSATLQEQKSLALLCTALVITAMLPFPLSMVRLAGNKLATRRKDFQFFLCHHKAGAGAFTRLLKMSLLESSQVRGQVFVDSDNLRNLNDLFEQVAFQTENLVIVASRQIFTRPWCVGEMTVARLCNVRTVLLHMPDGKLPEEDFAKECGQMASFIECLSAYSIGPLEIQDTLGWVHDLPSFEVPPLLGRGMLQQLTAQICGDAGGWIGKQASTRAPCERSFILCNAADLEAMAAANVLAMMLACHFVHSGDDLPVALATDQELPDTGLCLVALLSAGFLEQRHCLQTLLRASRLHMRVLPVTLEETFRFPSRPDLDALLAAEGEEVVEAVEEALREISVPFQPQHAAQQTLELGAKEVARRILQKQQRGANDIGKTLSMTAQRSHKRSLLGRTTSIGARSQRSTQSRAEAPKAPPAAVAPSPPLSAKPHHVTTII